MPTSAVLKIILEGSSNIQFLKLSLFFRFLFRIPRLLAEVGKVTLKSNGDEAFSDEFLLKSNGDEALSDVFSIKSNGDEAFNAQKKL
jgi:hypothetical protein